MVQGIGTRSLGSRKCASLALVSGEVVVKWCAATEPLQAAPADGVISRRGGTCGVIGDLDARLCHV